MRAVQLIEIEKDLENREVQTPKPQSDEVLVRIKASGICHSDVHYRDGISSVDHLPITLGHEIAGVIEEIGTNVTSFQKGDRVCVNYMITCGECHFCIIGSEQFCEKGKMMGKDVNGGYAEYIAVPSRGIYKLPDSVPFEHAAVMMCSTATSFHALKKTRFQPGETIAIFGFGGLGVSAFQLAKIIGARDIYAIDIAPEKLQTAKKMGAIPINSRETNPVEKILELTNGFGVDVALELVGLPQTLDQGFRVLARFGRLGLVGITRGSFEIDSYGAICKEKELIGCSDHLLSELPALLDLAEQGKLDLNQVVTKKVPLEASEINIIHHQLKDFKADIRTVIVP